MSGRRYARGRAQEQTRPAEMCDRTRAGTPAHKPRRAQLGANGLPIPLEKDIQQVIVDGLRLLGWAVWIMQVGTARGGAVYSTPGIPDLFVFHRDGRAAWIEVKRPRLGRLDRAQIDMHAQLARAGFPHGVVTDLDAALDLLRSI